jgi:hypothetical protein
MIRSSRNNIIHDHGKSDLCGVWSHVASRVTLAFVHYKTPDLLEKAVRPFKSFYPKVPTIIFDNGSGESSLDLIQVEG